MACIILLVGDTLYFFILVVEEKHWQLVFTFRKNYIDSNWKVYLQKIKYRVNTINVLVLVTSFENSH